MLSIGASVLCFGVMLLGVILVFRNRLKADQTSTDSDPSWLWLLIGLGMMGGILFAAM